MKSHNGVKKVIRNVKLHHQRAPKSLSVFDRTERRLTDEDLRHKFDQTDQETNKIVAPSKYGQKNERTASHTTVTSVEVISDEEDKN